MTIEEAKNITKGDELLHMDFGPVSVVQTEGIRVLLEPLTNAGRKITLRLFGGRLFWESNIDKIDFFNSESVSRFFEKMKESI